GVAVGGGSGLATPLCDELIPERNVVRLLARVCGERWSIRARLRGARGGRGRRSQRDNGVSVLPGVVRKLAARERSLRPAHVERVAQGVLSRSDDLQSVPEVHLECSFQLRAPPRPLMRSRNSGGFSMICEKRTTVTVSS